MLPPALNQVQFTRGTTGAHSSTASCLPRSWTGDRPRCREAGISDDAGFAAKPELARKMIARAVTARVPFSRFAADEG